MIAIFLFLLGLGSSHTANILVVIPFTSKSHYEFARPLILGLVERGHNLTVLASFIEDIPFNYTGIKTPAFEACEEWSPKKHGGALFKNKNPFVFANVHHMNGLRLCLANSSFEVTVPLLKATKLKFDLVITEFFYQESTAILATFYESPLVIFSTLPFPMRLRYMIGSSMQLSSTHHEYAVLNDRYTFMSRLKNLNYILSDILCWKFLFLKKHTEVAEHFFPEIPKDRMDLEAVIRNASLFMVNSPISMFPMHGAASNVIDISGIHIGNPEPLSEELQELLDDSNGFILFSFGSILNCNEISTDIMNNLYNSFAKLKETVLWKCDADESLLKRKPHNVIMMSWIPQKSVLAHPKIKLFISHGGFLSVQEAVHNAVPIMGFPTFSDQHQNMQMVKENGCGIVMSTSDIEGERFGEVLRNMLNNETYKYNAEILSKRFRGRPVSVLENALFWIEYVIENNGADFMKVPLSKMHWIQYEMIDIYLFLLLVLILGLGLLFFCIRQIISKVKELLHKTASTNKLKKDN